MLALILLKSSLPMRLSTVSWKIKNGSGKTRFYKTREIENMQAELSKADMRKIDEAKVKMFKYFLSRL